MARKNPLDLGVVIYGTGADDELYGTKFDDLFFASSGGDAFNGGLGIDTVSYANARGGVHVNLDRGYGSGGIAAGDTYDGIENIVGSQHDDTILGDSGNNRLDGLSGDDLLYGLAGNDVILGGDGDDTIFAGAGADVVNGGDGIDTASYRGSGAGVNIDLAAGTAMGGDATLDVITNIENLVGSSRHGDTLAGDEGDNMLDGWGGDDTFFGTAGNDIIIGGLGTDTLDYSRLENAVFVDLREGGEVSKLIGTIESEDTFNFTGVDQVDGIETFIGTDFDDVFASQAFMPAHDLSFFGGAGNDSFLAAFDAEHFDGGSGTDTIVYTESSEGVTVDLTTGIGSGGDAEGDTYFSIERVNGSNHADILIGDNQVDGFNILQGGDGADVLVDTLGEDWLIGDLGATGGSWGDTFVFGDTREAEADTIFGFEAGLDVIDFSDTAFTGWDDLFNEGSRYIEQDGDDAVIHYYDHTITLSSVQVADLSETDFLF